MSMFEFRLTPDGGETFDLAAGMRDVRAWEKTHRGRSMGTLNDASGVSATVLYEIAYATGRRHGVLPEALTEADFCERYELEVESPEEKAARVRAENLKRQIETSEVPNESDPTPEGA